MIRIGEFSKLAKTTVKTLRFYDEIDLFKPKFVDDNGYRYYELNQLNELIKIVTLRNMNLPIDSIKKILDGEDILKVCEEHLSSLERNLVSINKNIEDLKLFIEEQGGVNMNYSAKIVEIPEYKVYKRHGVIDSMDKLFDFVLSAGEECAKNNPTLECVDYCYVAYTAKEYKEKDVELEYVEAVKEIGKNSENIKFTTIPAIKAVSVEHKGKYENLVNAYAFALDYVKKNGYEVTGDIRESYVDGCWNKENEEDYLTVIQIPVK